MTLSFKLATWKLMKFFLFQINLFFLGSFIKFTTRVAFTDKMKYFHQNKEKKKMKNVARHDLFDTWLWIKQPVTLCGFLNSSNDDDDDDDGDSDHSDQIITNGSADWVKCNPMTKTKNKQEWMKISSHFTHKKFSHRLACALPFQLCQHYCLNRFLFAFNFVSFCH